MLLTVHALTGVLIGQQTDNAYLAFLIGFITHFLFDMIPHGDNDMMKGYYSKENVKKMLSLIVIDSIVMCAVILYLFSKIEFANPFVVAMGVLGSIIPDFLVACEELSEKYLREIKPLKKFYDFHTKVHTKIKRFNPSFLKGLILQVVLLLVLFKIFT